jgi:hypothetical protein
MLHVAVQRVDYDGNGVTWGEHVTDDEYDIAPGSDH